MLPGRWTNPVFEQRINPTLNEGFLDHDVDKSGFGQLQSVDKVAVAADGHVLGNLGSNIKWGSRDSLTLEERNKLKVE